MSKKSGPISKQPASAQEFISAISINSCDPSAWRSQRDPGANFFNATQILKMQLFTHILPKFIDHSKGNSLLYSDKETEINALILLKIDNIKKSCWSHKKQEMGRWV